MTAAAPDPHLMSEQRPPRAPSTTAWQAAAHRAVAGRPIVEPRPEAGRVVVVAAHGGAGATTWSRILGGLDAGSEIPAGTQGPVVVVARASIAGIDAAKAFIRRHGAPAIACVLVVPAAPGRTHKTIRNELRVLGGAVRLVETPWVPELLALRPAEVSETDVPPKDLARLRAELPTTSKGDHQ